MVRSPARRVLPVAGRGDAFEDFDPVGETVLGIPAEAVFAPLSAEADSDPAGHVHLDVQVVPDPRGLDRPEWRGGGWSRKGLQFAIEGVRQANLSRPLLLVAGRGDSRHFSATGRVQFLGPVRDMEPYLAAADVFILPTIYDPFSNACLEALAAGLAVITTAANGFSEILQPGIDGEVLDDPSDSEALARAIEGWGNPERRMAIKPHLRDLASKLSIEQNVKATLEVIQGAKADQFTAVAPTENLKPPRCSP